MGTDSGAPSSYPSTFTENGEKVCIRPVKAFDSYPIYIAVKEVQKVPEKKKKKESVLKTS